MGSCVGEWDGGLASRQGGKQAGRYVGSFTST